MTFLIKLKNFLMTTTQITFVTRILDNPQWIFPASPLSLPSNHILISTFKGLGGEANCNGCNGLCECEAF